MLEAHKVSFANILEKIQKNISLKGYSNQLIEVCHISRAVSHSFDHMWHISKQSRAAVSATTSTNNYHYMEPFQLIILPSGCEIMKVVSAFEVLHNIIDFGYSFICN